MGLWVYSFFAVYPPNPPISFQIRFSGPSNENPYAKLLFWDPLMRILMPNSFSLFRPSQDSFRHKRRRSTSDSTAQCSSSRQVFTCEYWLLSGYPWFASCALFMAGAVAALPEMI